MGTRMNILTNPIARDDFLDAVVALDETPSGVMVSDAVQFIQANNISLSLSGTEQELSFYDLIVLWHVIAMSIPMPGAGPNLAHNGPIFLPWHRHYMILVEQWMQIILGKPDFGLPYWDWAADGDLPATEQWRTTLWSSDYLGESRNTVVSGRLANMRVRLWQPGRGFLSSIQPRPLRRDAGRDGNFQFQTLPTSDEVRFAMQQPMYDMFPYSSGSPGGHRNFLEGWRVPNSAVRTVGNHNLVHVWIGGDMSPGSSPNDPVFFLNHCNVDRIWESWMNTNGRVYVPDGAAVPPGHGLNDNMYTLVGDVRTPQDVLETLTWYDYDSLAVA